VAGAPALSPVLVALDGSGCRVASSVDAAAAVTVEANDATGMRSPSRQARHCA